jgi:hypothetical protein
MSEVKITTEQNNNLDDIQNSDCISVPSENRSASILGTYPTANFKVDEEFSTHFDKALSL